MVGDLINLQRGIEEIGVPQFDPLVYKNLRFNFNNPMVLLSSLVIKKVKVVGFANTKIMSVKSRFTEDSMNAVINVEIPKAIVEGVYKGEGRYSNLRYGPQGYFNATGSESINQLK